MRISKEGKEFIKQYESFSSTAYKNTNDGWTIGYGNKFYEDNKPVRPGDKMTRQRAEQLFENIVNKFAAQVDGVIRVPVPQRMFDMLVSYAYNRGFETFRLSQVLKAVNRGETAKKIAELFVTYWGNNVKYKTGLVRRRKAEGEYFLKTDNPMTPYGSPLAPFLAILSYFGIKFYK